MNEAEQFIQSDAQGDTATLPYPDELTFLDAAWQGLNPISLTPWKNVFWRSLANNMKDTVVGIPQLPGLALGMAKELPNLRHIPGNINDADGLINILEESNMPILAAMLADYRDAYFPVQGQAWFSGFKRTLATDPWRIITDLAALAVPGGAAVGGAAKGAKLSGRLGKVAKTLGKTGKAVSKTGEIVEKIGSAPAVLGEKVLKGAAGKVKKQFAMNPDSYNQPIEINTGVWDEASGQYIKQTITPVELAQRLSESAGVTIDPKDLPIQAITDNEIPITFEEILRKTEEEIAPKIAAEYDTASELVKDAQTGLEKDRQIDTGVRNRYKNPYDMGQHLQEYYRQAQRGERGEHGTLYRRVQSNLEVPISQLSQHEFYQLFRKTNAYIEELVEPYEAIDYMNGQIADINKITNPDIKATVKAYQDIMIHTLSEMDQPTYNTVRTARTDFGDQANIFARQGEILAIGEGSVSSQIYKKMTEDITDIIEQGVKDRDFHFGHNELFENLTEPLTDDLIKELAAQDPDWADWNNKQRLLAGELRSVNKRYAEWLDLEDSEAGKWFREGLRDPGAMLDQVLESDSILVGDEIVNMKKILEHRWTTFQAALLNRLFEKSMRLDESVTPMGLKTIIRNINSKDKNRLNDLFNNIKESIPTSQKLHEIAEFRERVFGPKGKWNTPYAQQIIGKYLADPDFTNILLTTGMLDDSVANAFYDAAKHTDRIVNIPALQYLGAVNLVLMGALYFPKKIRKNQLISGGYKDWMTDGYKGLEINVPIGKEGRIPISADTPGVTKDPSTGDLNLKIKINAQTFEDLEFLVDKYGWYTFYPGKVAERARQKANERKQKATRRTRFRGGQRPFLEQ